MGRFAQLEILLVFAKMTKQLRALLQSGASTAFRYLLVGLFNTAIGYGTSLILLNVFGFPYYPSTLGGNSLGLVSSYFLNRSFTFSFVGDHRSAFFKFMLSFALCYGISYKLAEVLFGVGTVAVTFGAVMYSTLNYFFNKHFVFRKIKELGTT
jgi:putative flippase GtrA